MTEFVYDIICEAQRGRRGEFYIVEKCCSALGIQPIEWQVDLVCKTLHGILWYLNTPLCKPDEENL